jgi:hypothetical protein
MESGWVMINAKDEGRNGDGGGEDEAGKDKNKPWKRKKKKIKDMKVMNTNKGEWKEKTISKFLCNHSTVQETTPQFAYMWVCKSF